MITTRPCLTVLVILHLCVLIALNQQTKDTIIVCQATEGYSGSDIRLVCKEAAMRPIRKIFDTLENHTDGTTLLTLMRFLHKICTDEYVYEYPNCRSPYVI